MFFFKSGRLCRKTEIILLLLTFLFSNLFSEGAKNNDSGKFKWYGTGQPFELSYAADIPLASACAGLYFPTLIYENFFNSTDIPFNGEPLDKSKINAFDRTMVFEYSKPQDNIADGISITLFALPAVFMAFQEVPKEDWITIGVMYAETYFLTRGLKELCKLSLNRARPYMYYDSYPQKEVDKGDWYMSFPSGHTAYAFATAAFSTVMCNTYIPGSPWAYAIIGGTYLLATIDGMLRITSGNHFITDVLLGAAIGTIIGYTIPYLHTLTFQNAASRTSQSVSPVIFNIQLQL